MDLGIIGGRGHASDLLELVGRSAPSYAVVGCFAEPDPGHGRLQRQGVPYLGPLSEVPADLHVLLGVGYPDGRRQVADLLAGRPVPPALVDPAAVVSASAELGEGTAIFWHASVSPLARIGAHVVVSYGATVGHDTAVGDFSSVMPGARLSGDVTVGAGVLIGTGAVVLEKLTVGDGARVGAGAVVTRDVPPGATVTGTPARRR